MSPPSSTRAPIKGKIGTQSGPVFSVINISPFFTLGGLDVLVITTLALPVNEPGDEGSP